MKNKVSPAWISVAAILIIWQLAADRIQLPALFPSVIDLFQEVFVLLTLSGTYQSFFSTVLKGLEAFLLGACIALPASVVALHSPFWKSFFNPLVITLRSIPVIAVVLIALMFLTPSHLPVIIGSITMLPILYQNFLSAWEHTDKKLVEMAKFYHKSLWERFRYVYFIQSPALLFAGLATAIGFGWRAIIIGEVLSGPALGIGTAMKKSQAYIDMPGLLAWTLIAVAGGFLAEFALKSAARINYNPSLRKSGGKTDDGSPASYRSVKLVEVSFFRASTPILQRLSLTIDNSAIVLLKSPSGSGKTTVLNLLSGLLKPNEGQILLQNVNSCSCSFQDKRLIPALTVEQNIAFVLPHFPALTTDQHHRLNELMIAMELQSMSQRFPPELSGGEQQRVALARSLMQPSDLLLLDEPLTGIGTELKNRIVRFIEQDSRYNKPVIVWATHENPEEILKEQTHSIQHLQQ